MKILQAIMHNSRTAGSLLSQFIVEHHSDVVLISEQHFEKKKGRFLEDGTGTAAICLPSKSRLLINDRVSGNGFV